MIAWRLAVLLMGVAIAAESTPARAEPAEVEALIAKGNEQRRMGHPGEALELFQKAYEIARTPRTMGQLGLAELAAGFPVEAADHLATALNASADPSIAKYRKVLTDALARARSQIGELTVGGGPEGAEVIVNGHSAGLLPLASPIKVATGNVLVVVRAANHHERTQSIRIGGGQRQELTVRLEAVEPVPTSASVVDPPATGPAVSSSAEPPPVIQNRTVDATAPGTSLRTTAWIVGGGAALAVTAGLALNLAARSKISEFNADCARLPTGIVAGGNLSVEACTDRYDAWSSYRLWSIVGYASGATLAVASSILLWTSRPERAGGGDVRARLTCAPGLNGLACQGVF